MRETSQTLKMAIRNEIAPSIEDGVADDAAFLDGVHEAFLRGGHFDGLAHGAVEGQVAVALFHGPAMMPDPDP
jgi:hypothetical protein